MQILKKDNSKRTQLKGKLEKVKSNKTISVAQVNAYDAPKLWIDRAGKRKSRCASFVQLTSQIGRILMRGEGNRLIR